MSTRNLLPSPEIAEAEHVDEYDVGERVEALEKEVAELRSEMERDRQQVAALLGSARVTFGNPRSGNAPASGPVESDKWEKMKMKLGGKMADVIAALQLSGTATTTQLYKQAGGGFSTVKNAIYKLSGMGLLVKNGDGWSLKP